MARRGAAPTTVTHVRVELFGIPRIVAGMREVGLAIEAPADRRALLHSLGQACPSLAGKVILADASDLQDGYVFNLNGTAFLEGEMPRLREGDSLLLLSNQAGG